YDRNFGDQHHLTVLAGQSAQQFTYTYLSAGRSGYGRNDLQTINNGPGADPAYPISNGGTGIAPPVDRLASYFGRVNYEFAGKYLLTVTARYDGTSAFAPGRKFGFFPGASLGWRLSDENFVKNVAAISNLKLRVGYGKVGNPLNAGRFAYLATINSGITYPFGAGVVNNGAAPTRSRNDDLRWENNYQANIGVDLGLFQNRVEVTADVYDRRSPNLISYVPAYLVTGTYESVPTNALSAYNRGLDLAVTTRNVIGSGLNWTSSLVFSTFKNEITDLGVGVPFNGTTTRTGVALVRYEKGQPFGEFYGYVADGLFQTQEEINAYAKQPGAAPGDIRFKDVDGNGVINDQDRTYIGSPIPKFTYGLNNTVTFHGFDLNLFLQGSQGNKVYNLNRVYTEGGLTSSGNSSTRVLARWTGPGTSNEVPRAIAGDPNQNLRVSSYFVEDGSYLRIKVLTLGYSLPKTLLSRFGTQTVRVYVTGQNLLTLTKYSGFDPELGGSGIDRGVYPQSRVFLAGINLGF
ncbi:MAG: hypothetical protein JWR44_514, partial [Hymenobacter sp.]|nr:hypothetical protein [Hymenobacter sp.]